MDDVNSPRPSSKRRAELMNQAAAPAICYAFVVMSAAPALRYSFSEYMTFERDARDKHEFVRGLILAMAGGTLEHAALCSAVIAALSAQLRERRCRVFDSNARVRVSGSGNAYYPDASVVCEHLAKDLDDDLSMTNPAVLVEVLSPSTEEYDRTDKLRDYQTIPSLKHIVYIAHAEKRVDVWTRENGAWTLATFGANERATLSAIECVLDVAELYRDPLA